METKQTPRAASRKPVGGIAAAAMAAAPGYGGDAIFTTYPILEDRSSYEETTHAPDGVPCVEHRLTLVFDKHEAQRHFTPEWLERCIRDGIVARIDTAAGERLVVGHCPRLNGEQPLRLESYTCSSGTRPSERPTATLVLVCRDTGPAQIR